MKKHYFEFNNEEKELNELGKYDFKYGLNGGYRYYFYENCYNSRKNQWLNIWVNAFGKVSALAEKDKEIDKLSKEHLEMFGDMKTYKNLWLAEQRKNKEIRKQVCDEIREKIKKRIIEEDISEWNPDYGDQCWLYAMKVDMTKILDQIEKGE